MIFAVLVASMAVSQARADADVSFQRCVELLTQGAYYSSSGTRYTHNDTVKWPRLPSEAALRVCSVDPAKRDTAQRCLYELAAGVSTQSDGDHNNPAVVERWPHHDPVQASRLCAANADSEASWKRAGNCLNELMHGILVSSSGGRSVATDQEKYPRIREVAAVEVCRRPQESYQDSTRCFLEMARGITFSSQGSRIRAPNNPPPQTVPDMGAAHLCGRNPSEEGRACLRNRSLRPSRRRWRAGLAGITRVSRFNSA